MIGEQERVLFEQLRESHGDRRFLLTMLIASLGLNLLLVLFLVLR